MAIKVKVVRQPEFSFFERLQFPQILTGLLITLKSIFRSKITVSYPDEIKELPPNYRGLHEMPADDDGEIRCVACKLCEVACPTQAISIVSEPAGDYGIERRPSVYNIDFMRCVFCGFCVEACPCDALRMGMEYELASYNRAGLVHTKEVFFKPHLKSDAPRDNANFLYQCMKGNIIDDPEEIGKVKTLDGSYRSADDSAGNGKSSIAG
ncbi:MAG: 4Fe-4S dicluster domain-containing protein [Candidatus Mycalebacterium zealandia]|nr:MAG: 4Fe-4S dicluster domain-containing protein [Candidatus Mycalebacterium zealandia]